MLCKENSIFFFQTDLLVNKLRGCPFLFIKTSRNRMTDTVLAVNSFRIIVNPLTMRYNDMEKCI